MIRNLFTWKHDFMHWGLVASFAWLGVLWVAT